MKKTNHTAAIITYSYFSKDSRVQRYSESLKKYGFQVNVFSLYEIFHVPSSYSFFMFPIKRRRLGILWYFIEYFLFLLFCFFYLTLNSFRKRYRIIHVFNMPDFIVLAAMIPKLLGAKIILEIRDRSSNLFQTKFSVDKNHPLMILLSLLERSSIFFVDKILTANPIFKTILTQKYPLIKNKIEVIYECADQKIFFPKKQDFIYKKRIINLLYFGTIEERFAIEEIVKSFALVVKKNPRCRLLLIPKISEEGKYFDSICNIIKKCNLNSYVKVLSPLPLYKMAKEVQKADIGFVLVKKDPYTDIIHRTKLYEFIACKIPVIATKTKLLTRFFSKEQLVYINDNSLQELSNAILKLSLHTEYRRKLTESAFLYYEKYNWKNEEKKYFQILNQLLQ